MGQLLVMLGVLVGQLRIGGQLVAGHGLAGLCGLVGNGLHGLGMAGFEAGKLLAVAPVLRSPCARTSDGSSQQRGAGVGVDGGDHLRPQAGHFDQVTGARSS